MGLMSFLSLGGTSNAWGVPIKNFGEVIPNKIYRSSAPELLQIEAARKKIGLKAILDLRDGWDPKAWKAYQALLWKRYAITAYNVAFDDKEYPNATNVSIAINILSHEENWPILVHCQGGRHRTGGIVAAYRKKFQGWTAEECYAEAKRYRWYSLGHGAWKDFILGRDPNKRW